MTLTDYHTLLAVMTVTLLLLTVPPVITLMRLDSEAAKERAAAKARIAARQAAKASLPAILDDEPAPEEET
ncbi:putative membrane protein [Candidatus Protofrankia californiensis]|uniref:Putative membrane protein n=1 Tax=Candidatus Protofrankia californiensis TaxID=1839754 RepID=A0A1C3P3W0_9ACTN|nr:putative membrane protein [Candidatus Protofrankia californiensis]